MEDSSRVPDTKHQTCTVGEGNDLIFVFALDILFLIKKIVQTMSEC